ncbi:TIGR03936 family radical SAM-associated protein, partial [Kibdelosporangium lantanae]
MQKLRLRYAKRGRLRFTSHRDIARAFERALRRSGAPMAFSQGFNPHPKISWIGAAPTGAASEAEYVEIQLVEVVEPAKLAASPMPSGIRLQADVPYPFANRVP